MHQETFCYGCKLLNPYHVNHAFSHHHTPLVFVECGEQRSEFKFLEESFTHIYILRLGYSRILSCIKKKKKKSFSLCAHKL